MLEGELPTALAEAAIAYAGCVAGAQTRDTYLETIKAAGFDDARVRAARPVRLPDTLLEEILGAEGAADLHRSGFGIFSITVVGYKNAVS